MANQTAKSALIQLLKDNDRVCIIDTLNANYLFLEEWEIQQMNPLNVHRVDFDNETLESIDQLLDEALDFFGVSKKPFIHVSECMCPEDPILVVEKCLWLTQREFIHRKEDLECYDDGALHTLIDYTSANVEGLEMKDAHERFKLIQFYALHSKEIDKLWSKANSPF